MFGQPRLEEFFARYDGRLTELIPTLLETLEAFSGAVAEPEDDITALALNRTGRPTRTRS